VTAFILANVMGLAGLLWPLVLGTSGVGEANAHATDAPVIVAFLVPLLVLVAIDTAHENRDAPRDARLIALLGVLVAVNAFLRIPKGPSGEGLMFVLPILAGWYIGARFAFLLGAFSILASAVLTGGVGPWLPFQMFALGWVGAGAGLVRRTVGGRLPIVALGVYAYISSIAYGFVMTLWFWPFLGQGGPTFFSEGLGLGETFVRYWRFYSLTSLPWDTGRAILANVPLVVILAKPVGNLFARVKERFAPQIVVLQPATPSAP
jgi:energy-coupling factor transport system substrate-specific component